MKQFVDQTPDGGVFTYASKDGGTLTVYTVYDDGGKLAGVQVKAQ